MPPALITFPTSSVDELTDQFENSNKRISERCNCSQNDDQHINHPFLQTTGGNHRCLLIHCLSQRLSRIVRCRVTSSRQSTKHSTTCLFSQDFNLFTPGKSGFKGRGGTYRANNAIIPIWKINSCCNSVS